MDTGVAFLVQLGAFREVAACNEGGGLLHSLVAVVDTGPLVRVEEAGSSNRREVAALVEAGIQEAGLQEEPEGRPLVLAIVGLVGLLLGVVLGLGGDLRLVVVVVASAIRDEAGEADEVDDADDEDDGEHNVDGVDGGVDDVGAVARGLPRGPLRGLPRGPLRGPHDHDLRRGPHELLRRGPHEHPRGPHELSRGPHELPRGPHELGEEEEELLP